MTDPLSLRAMAEWLRELDTKATPAPWHTNAADYGCPISDDTGGSIIAVWPERANGSKVDAEANGALVTFVRNNLSQIIEALTAQSSWANEKAEMERQLAAYRDPDWTKNPRTARSDKNMEDGWALGEAKEAAEAALAEADRLGADYMDEDHVLPPEEAIRIGSACLRRHKERLASLPLAAKTDAPRQE